MEWNSLIVVACLTNLSGSSLGWDLGLRVSVLSKA